MARKPILIAFAILLLPLVLALSEDFQASAPAEIPVFFCAPAQSQFTISNTGSVASVYSIFYSGDAASFATVDFPSFSLEPGQSATLTTFLQVPCDARGRIDLNTLVQTSFGAQKSFSQDIVVFTPDNIDATMTPEERVVSPCEVGTHIVTITNPVNYDEVYSFGITGLDFATLSENEVSLAPGESKDITVRAEQLDCTVYGSWPFALTITTQNSGIQETLAGTFTIEPNYIPSITMSRTRFTNFYEEQWIPVQIENIGDVDTIYALSVEGAGFATVEPTNALIAGRSTETINVKLAPAEDAVVGLYEISVRATVIATNNTYVASPFTVKLRAHNALTRFYADHPVYSWLIILGSLIILGLLIVLIVYLSLPSTREKRRINKIARTKRKIEKQKEKLKRKEEKRRAKAKRTEEKRKAKEKKQAEKERARKQQELERKKAQAAKEKEEAQKKKARQDALKAKRAEKNNMIREVRKDFFLVKKSDEGFTPLVWWKKLLIGLGLLIIVTVLVVLTVIFWDIVVRFAVSILIAWLIVALLIVILLWRRYHSLEYFARREQRLQAKEQAVKDRLARERQEAKDKIKREREEFKARIREEKEKAQQKKEEERAKKEELKAKAEAKKSEKKAPKTPRSWKWLGILITLIIIAGIITLVSVFWRQVISFWPAVVVGLVILAIIFYASMSYQSKHIRKSWPFAKGWVFAQTKWRKGLGEIRFKLNKTGEDVRVRIDYGRMKDVFVVPMSTVYQYFRAEVHAEYDRARAAFRVKKGFADHYSVKLCHFNGGKWTDLKVKEVSSDRKYVYFTADLPALGQFAIAGEKKPVKRSWWPWFVVIALLLIGLGTTMALIGQTQTPDFNGIPPQEWLQDSVHVLDLNQFFEDPDGDELVFRATTTDNVDIFIDSEGRAVFTPDAGFVGEEAVIFTGRDARGGAVQSNRVLLKVLPSPVPVKYLPQLKVGLIIVLILVLLIVLVRFRRQLLDYISE